MIKTLASLVAMTVIWTSAAEAQSVRDDPRVVMALELVETWLDAQRDYKQMPGISVGIVHDQELIWSGGFGYANPAKKVPATPETIYSICSISKLFTSIALMQLRDEGKVRLDDTPGQHLPWYDIENTHGDGPAVTIRGLLTHSSGLPRESDFPYWTEPDFDFPSHDKIVERLETQQTLYPADTYFQYSNLGLTLIGEIVAAVSGQPYEEYVSEHILKPLGLENTRTELPESIHGSGLAIGHTALTRNGSRDSLPIFQAEGIAPAAGFSSTVKDLGLFASWQFRVLSGKDDDVLGLNTLREMHRVHWLDPDWKTSRGLGFGISRKNDKTIVGHGGGCPGYSTKLALDPKGKVAVIVMINASGVAPSEYADRIHAIVGPAIAEAMKKPDEAKSPESNLDKFLGNYSAQPWGGEMAVVRWKESLAILPLPTDDPLERLIKLKHIEGETFRRIRDDEELGEEIVFELGSDGEVTRMKRHSNYKTKIQ